MSAAEYAKSKGFKSLIEVCEVLGVHKNTMRNRFNNNKKLFEESVDSALKIREGRLKK